MLSIGGLISTDIFLPALADMSEYYHVSKSNIQNAIAIFLFAIAVGQLIYGPLSDSLGRKKILISGLFLWFGATVGSLYTNQLESLLFLRFLQGLGACAGIVLSREIVNDLLDKQAAGQVYLIIFPFVGASPAIAPLIGGELLKYFPWQSSFIFLCLFILVTILLTWFFLPESLRKENRVKLSPFSIVKGIRGVLKNKQFLFYALIPCFAYAAYFAYIIESPFLLEGLGMSPQHIGYSYIGLSFSYILGNLTAKKVIQHRSIEKTIKIGYRIFVVASVLFFLQMLASPYPLVTSLLTISTLTYGNGFLLPLGTSLAISSHPNAMGSASGVMGALQLSSASVSAALIGKISGHSPLITASFLMLICVLGFITYYWKGSKYAAI